MTDTERQESYRRRDELRLQDHDALQTVLKLVLEQTRAFNALNEGTTRHREWLQAKLDRIEGDLASLREADTRQSRVSDHTSRVAEEALTLAEQPSLRREVRTHASLWAALIGLAAALGAPAIQYLAAPLLARLLP